jgi:acylphosphatase
LAVSDVKIDDGRIPLQRVNICYSGRVQGVGFRATVLDISRNFGVVGYVRNMLDGSVEMLAEGEPDQLQDFCSAIQRRLDRYIVSENAAWSDVEKHSFPDFSIAPTE